MVQINDLDFCCGRITLTQSMFGVICDLVPVKVNWFLVIF